MSLNSGVDQNAMPKPHALRPSFTHSLASRLSNGAASINLISPHGQGRRRTLMDLRRYLSPSMEILQANLRDHTNSLTSLLSDLGSQSDLDHVNHIEVLFDRLQQRPNRTLIILHNFDELVFGEESGYDDAFFKALNSVSDRSFLSLLCISEQTHPSWPLNIDTVTMPPLTVDEILAEISRRNPSIDSVYWPGIADWISAQLTPYTLLEHPDSWPDLP